CAYCRFVVYVVFFFFSSRRRHTRFKCDWSSDVCSPISLIAGCATLEPNAVRAFVGHESHTTQHAPFTSHQTNYGRGAEVGIITRSEERRVGKEGRSRWAQ